jgi:hypothetical protein
MKVLLFIVISIAGHEPKQMLQPMDDIKACTQTVASFLESKLDFKMPPKSFIQASCVLVDTDTPA